MNKMKNIFDLVSQKLSISLFSYREFSINIWQIILATLFFFIGIIVIRFFIRKLKQWKFLVTFDEHHDSVAIINLINLALHILLFIFSCGILGFRISVLSSIWKFSIFKIGDSNISLGNLIIGTSFFIIASRLIRIFRPKTDQYMSKLLKLDFSTHNTALTIIEYISVIIILLFSLSIIGIPLTAFTMIGGTLAIGIGLGSQNLINNFISGFVLMGEAHSKIGDVIELDEHIGTIEKIGFRSTVIKTFTNVRLIIPNSSLLEKNVINWSLKDKILRRKITIGVAYGANVDRVKQLFIDSVKTHNGIRPRPEPFVIFQDFGDNALIFEIYFFVDLINFRKTLNIESEIRSLVYKALAKEEIGIPFPQRDVHIFQDKPIDVNVRK